MCKATLFFSCVYNGSCFWALLIGTMSPLVCYNYSTYSPVGNYFHHLIIMFRLRHTFSNADETRVKEFQLKSMWRSPNGTIRNILNGLLSSL